MTLNRPYLPLLPRTILFISTMLTFLAFTATAQNAVFTPDEEQPEFFLSMSRQYEQVYKSELGGLPQQYRQDFQKIYEQRWKHIRSKFESKEIYAGKDAQAYLDALTAEIVNANPSLRAQNFRCYFSRSGVPNASYIGQGIILFNMGLFQRLNNESEAAFIISHEIAHFVLKHSENAMSRYVNAINSEATQNKLREIKGSEYKKREQVDKLVETLTFDSRRHSRDRENDADSLAVELMRNTRFAVSTAISTLDILDQADKDTLQIAGILEKTFHSPSYPFRKKWLAKEEGLLGGHAKLKQDSIVADSLKTHPDCRLRIATLQPLVDKYASQQVVHNAANSRQFSALQEKFRYEIISYSFNNNYTQSLYYTLQLLQQKPADPFLITHTGRIFNGLYAARKEHRLGKVTDLPAPYFSAGYNTLLQFVQNLYIEDVASIGYYFLKPHSPDLSGYELYNKTLEASKRIATQ